MTKKQTVLYSIAFWAILAGALVIEGRPLWSLAAVAVSGLCVWIAERR